MRGKQNIFAGALCLALLLSACNEPEGEPAPTQTLRPAVISQGERMGDGFTLPCCPGAGFHPITGTNRLNLTLAPLVYRGLFLVDGQFQAQRDLCESYTVSEDGLVWTFHLTHAVFSDGSPLTAQEVVASLQAAHKSDRYRGRLQDVERVAAEGNTVVVTLSRPRGTMPLLLDIPIVKEGEDPQRPYGTGPYAVMEREEGFVLVARQGAQVPLAEIPLRMVEAGDDLVYAFDAQEISLVDTDLTGTNALGYSGRLETTDYPTTTLLYIGCNLTSGPCRDQQVRQAVALALDREEMVRTALAGHAVVSALPVHPMAPGYDAALAGQWGLDQERAVALLAEGGWTRNEAGGLERQREPLALRLIVNQDNAFKTAVAEEVAAFLEKLGCQVTLDKLSWEEFTADLGKGRFDLFLGETALTPDFDLEPLLGQNAPLNYAGFADQETRLLLERCRTSRGEERTTTLVNLCSRTAELAPIIPICFKNGSLLTQWGQVSGAAPVQRDVFFGIENWTVRNS